MTGLCDGPSQNVSALVLFSPCLPVSGRILTKGEGHSTLPGLNTAEMTLGVLGMEQVNFTDQDLNQGVSLHAHRGGGGGSSHPV